MADRADDRLKPAMPNEGISENANTKNTPAAADARRPESGRDNDRAPRVSPFSVHGEKRKAPPGPEDGGPKKSKLFSMSLGARPKVGGGGGSGGGIFSTADEWRKEESKSLGLAKPLAGVRPVKSVSLKLAQKPKEPELKMAPSRAVAKAFAEDSDEEEEMPPEAKMRMKNVGRETPTSAGPNSFNKSKYGFNDHARVWRKSPGSKSPDGDKK